MCCFFLSPFNSWSRNVEEGAPSTPAASSSYSSSSSRAVLYCCSSASSSSSSENVVLLLFLSLFFRKARTRLPSSSVRRRRRLFRRRVGPSPLRICFYSGSSLYDFNGQDVFVLFCLFGTLRSPKPRHLLLRFWYRW
jgi:hypothetical protein